MDEKIYYLRLLSYKIFYSDISKIEVEFSTVERTWSGSSDVKSVIESAQAIASSFSYTTQKVKNNTGASKYVQDWVQKGMNATVTKIVNNACLLYTSAHREAKKSAEDELESINDLVKQGYEAQTDALSKLIEKYKKLKDSELEAYRYPVSYTHLDVYKRQPIWKLYHIWNI